MAWASLLYVFVRHSAPRYKATVYATNKIRTDLNSGRLGLHNGISSSPVKTISSLGTPQTFYLGAL